MTAEDQIRIRIHGDTSLPTLIYLPGVHGDWTLVSSFRERMKSQVRFVEFTYPRTLTWSLTEYGRAVLEALAEHGIGEGVLLGESFGSQVAWEVIRQSTEGRHSCRPDSASAGIASGPADTSSADQTPIRATPPPGDRNVALPLEAMALILAGGFGRYPFMPLVDLTRWVWDRLPAWMVRKAFGGYAVFARWRHRHAPETKAAIREFLERRTPADLAAISHRFALIRGSDPTAIIRRVTVPVYHLAGFWDPVVFWPAAGRALRQNCPGFRGRRVIPPADHNVLGTAPDHAAEVVGEWLEAVSRK